MNIPDRVTKGTLAHALIGGLFVLHAAHHRVQAGVRLHGQRPTPLPASRNQRTPASGVDVLGIGDVHVTGGRSHALTKCDIY